MRPVFVIAAALAAFNVAGARESAAATPSTQRPNIIFIMSDDHAYQAISAYGSELSKLAPTPMEMF